MIPDWILESIGLKRPQQPAACHECGNDGWDCGVCGFKRAPTSEEIMPSGKLPPAPPPTSWAWQQDRPSGNGAAGDYLAHLQSSNAAPAAESSKPQIRIVPPIEPDVVPARESNSFLVQAKAAERIWPVYSAAIDHRGGTRVQDSIVIETKEDPMTVQRAWAPDYLVRAYFDQAEEWITADGRRIKVEEMVYDHALNTLLFLERVADDLPLRVELQETPLYKAIYGRVFTKLVFNATALAPEPLERVFLVGKDDINAYLSKVAGTNTEVILAYKGVTDLAPKRRTVTVTRMVSVAGYSWQVFDVEKQEPRTFLLERIASLDGPEL